MKQLYQLLCVVLALYLNTVTAQVTKITAPDFNIEDCFGWSVSINGNYAAIGNVYDDDNDIQSGSVYVYYFNGETWVEQDKLIASEGGFADYFGYAVSVYDDQIVTGAYRDFVGTVRSGSAYVYLRNGDQWIESARLTPFDPEEEDRFGAKVDIHGNYVAVGAYFDDDFGVSSGAVYIFQKTGSEWAFHQKITPDDLQTNDLFGTSVFFNDNSLFIGAIGNSTYAPNSGKVYVYELVRGNWTLSQELFPGEPMVDQRFGQDISANDSHLVVGANTDGEIADQAGAVYVYENTVDGWTQSQKLLPTDGHAGALFGNALSMHDGNLVVASMYNITQHGESGSIYIFSLDNESNWIQTSKIIPSDGHNQQRFGADVGLWGKNAISGAPYDEGMGYRCGASYIFDLNIILHQQESIVDDVQFLFSPNPVSGELELQSGGLLLPLLVEVSDARGSVVMRVKTDTPMTSISFHATSPGLYYLRVTDHEGFFTIRKIIVL